MSEERLSLSQINKMKHAVGLNNIRTMPKDGNYSAYRNFFAVASKDVDWEELVAIGYATVRYVEWCQEYVYYVSQKGLEYLGKLFGITIKEMK